MKAENENCVGYFFSPGTYVLKEKKSEKNRKVIF
jgi:hypothetical protein